MIKQRAIIIDDETDAIDVLKSLLTKYCPKVEIIKTFTEPNEAMAIIENLNYDLLFLDVEMPQMSGIEFISKIDTSEIHVIFSTAHDQYALPALKHQALDYLLKPVDYEELIQAVNKALPRKRHLKINSLSGTELINYTDILYAKASGTYAELYLTDGSKRMISQGLKYIENEFESEYAFRTHRSYVINCQYIDSYKLEKDKGFVTLQGNIVIPISRDRKEAFKENV
jgi:two-component system LytT family response regulator